MLVEGYRISGEKFVESEIGCFEIGLLSETDWKGTWTAMPAQRSGATMLLRREFEICSTVERAPGIYLRHWIS